MEEVNSWLQLGVSVFILIGGSSAAYWAFKKWIIGLKGAVATTNGKSLGMYAEEMHSDMQDLKEEVSWMINYTQENRDLINEVKRDILLIREEASRANVKVDSFMAGFRVQDK